jgi:putative FmdB family regulatory protein
VPLFEYRCESCNHRFEALVQGAEKPTCARCGARKLEKLISAFAVSTSSGSGRSGAEPSGPAGCGTCGDPRGPGSCRTDG